MKGWIIHGRLKYCIMIDTYEISVALARVNCVMLRRDE